MLLREQAINVIKKYVNEDNNIIFAYAFPYHIIPNEIKNDWDYESQLIIKEEIFRSEIRYAVFDFEEPIEIINQSTNEIIFRPKDKITYHYFINKLETLQEQFDTENDGNMEIEKFINSMNTLTDLEIFLIEQAKMILELKESFDKKITEHTEYIKEKWREEK